MFQNLQILLLSPSKINAGCALDSINCSNRGRRIIRERTFGLGISSNTEETTAEEPDFPPLSEERSSSQSMHKQSTSDALDGGYGWIAVMCCFFIQFAVVGIPSSAAPFGGIFSNYFGHRTTIFVGCTVSGLGLVIASFTTSIPVFVTSYGVMSGLGYALAYTPSISVIAQYFHNKSDRALAVTVIGAGMGASLCPLMMRFLTTHYTWRGSMTAMGCMLVQCCVFSTLLIPPRLCRKYNGEIYDQIPEPKPICRDIIDDRTLLNSTFVVHFVNMFMWYYAASTLWILLPDYALQSGMSRDQGALLLSAYNLGNTGGRILSAMIISRCHTRNRITFHYLSIILTGFCIAMYPAKTTFSMFVALSLINGFLFGIVQSTLPSVTVELYGQQRLTSALSYVVTSSGISFLVGPAIAGYLSEVTAGYEIPFIITGIIQFLSAIVLVPLVCWKQKRNRDIDIAPSD